MATGINENMSSLVQSLMKEQAIAWAAKNGASLDILTRLQELASSRETWQVVCILYGEPS